jgi:dihydropyrimidine dehydrogenase (NAD+) subunit PreA
MHYGYDIIDDLQDGLAFYLEDKGFARPADVIGKALPKIIGHGDLPRDRGVVSSLTEDLCVKCDLCYIACRDGGHQAISIDPQTRYPQIDEEKCPGCRLCVTVCPADALAMGRKKSA